MHNEKLSELKRNLEMHLLEDSNFRNECSQKFGNLYKVTQVVTKLGSGPEVMSCKKWNLYYFFIIRIYLNVFYLF